MSYTHCFISQIFGIGRQLFRGSHTSFLHTFSAPCFTFWGQNSKRNTFSVRHQFQHPVDIKSYGLASNDPWPSWSRDWMTGPHPQGGPAERPVALVEEWNNIMKKLICTWSDQNRTVTTMQNYNSVGVGLYNFAFFHSFLSNNALIDLL